MARRRRPAPLLLDGPRSERLVTRTKESFSPDAEEQTGPRGLTQGPACGFRSWRRRWGGGSKGLSGDTPPPPGGPCPAAMMEVPCAGFCLWVARLPCQRARRRLWESPGSWPHPARPREPTSQTPPPRTWLPPPPCSPGSPLGFKPGHHLHAGPRHRGRQQTGHPSRPRLPSFFLDLTPSRGCFH